MKLLLVDGHSLAYRAFFAMPPLSNSKGKPTGAVLGVANMIFRILKEEKPTHVIVFFDLEIPKFRLEAYEAYKAQRPETPNDLVSQFPPIIEFFQALGIKVIEEPGFEADDWIAAVVKQAEPHGFQTLILSGDLDLLQLVSEKTSVLVSKKGISQIVRYDLAEVEKRYGLKPSQLIDLKSLVGDASDNIKGVPGIGEKGGIKILQEWQSISNLLEHKNELTPKIRASLEASDEILKTNQLLVTLRDDAPLEFVPDEVRLVPYDPGTVREFLEKMEFKTLAARLDLGSALNFKAVDFELADSETKIAALAEKFRNAENAGLLLWPPLALWGQSPERGSFLAVEIPKDRRWVIPPEHLHHGLQTLFKESAKIPKLYSHNWKAVLLALRSAESKISRQSHGDSPEVFDVQIAGWLANSLRTNPELPELAAEHLNESIPETSEELPVLLAHWAGILPRLGETLEIKLQALELEAVYRDLESPLIPILADMEWEGVAIDLPYLASVSREFNQELAQIEADIYKDAGVEFNINSPKQLADVLYGKLNLAKGKKTKTGFSTNVEELERLAGDSPVAQKLLQYRELSKLQSTYIDVFPQLVDPERHRIHTTYLQTGTATGRLASKDPNLQNIPIRTDQGKKIRKAFTTGKPGWKILSADYSQIELRLLAHFSEDPVLLDAFANNEDIHTRTAAEIFNVSPEFVTPDMRRMAKVVNFGIIYGMTEHGLSQNLGMKKEEARDYITKYLSRFSRVKTYIETSLEKARETGTTRTLLGRMRPVPELASLKNYLRSQAERIGVNAPLQGTVADLMKLAMIRISRRLREERLGASLVMQVHDELVFEVETAKAQALAAMVKEEMEKAARLRVPLTVDVSLGENWAEMRGI